MARNRKAPAGPLRQTFTFLLPVAAALLLRSFVAEAAVIPSGSMIPTLQVGDRVVMSKLPFGLKVPFLPRKLLDGRMPLRGEVVIFQNPRDPWGDDLVKRVVAVGGDRVEVRRNTVYVNGRPVPRTVRAGACTYLERASLDAAPHPAACRAFTETAEAGPYTIYQAPHATPSIMAAVQVPPGHLFVMGDCRDNSSDSRYWGTVPYSHLKGTVIGVLWSWEQGEGPRWERWFSGL